MFIRHTTQDYLNIFKHTALGVSFHTWVKILVQYRFSVAWPFIPKAIFITFTSLVNIPFQLVEYFLFHQKIKKTKVKSPIFILGYPRSGTTYLHYLVSADPNFAFCKTSDAIIPHLTLTVGKTTEKILGLFMPETRPQDNMKAGAKMPKEEEFAMANMSTYSFMHGFYFPKFLLEVFRKDVIFNRNKNADRNNWKHDFHYLIQKITYKNKGRRLVLKSPGNTGRLKEIFELYPDAVFIHIYRNPYEVFQSNRVLYEKVLPVLNLHKTTVEAIDEVILKSYEQVYRKYLSDKKLIPKGRIMEVAYSDLVKAPLDQLQKIYSELDLGDFNLAKAFILQEVKSFDGYQKNKHSHLSKADISLIREHWCFFFEAYGLKKKIEME